ncbi:FAD-dependent oxidoreductase [Streptomyces sp. P17]|uniref:FAD-dependent oxidoreductase n=1 Tax=Streptomyces sp. P17 TaxID=3074716 RepID=UPI0028F4400F|nr:FAD-dependent oxidoreductase [Streptomyces sp. P17]MDT9698161.1 FAD-dependent monooxygenase [Streptomyces sp. P17]
MAPTPEQSVIIVGAGPTGLALACELAAAGVACTVLERRTAPSTQSRAMGVYSRTMEVLDLRGHADSLTAVGRPVGRMLPAPGAAIDFTAIDSPFPALYVLPQSRTEEALQQRAIDLGVIVQRGAEVFGLEQDATGVRLHVRTESGEWEESADYVVGCDGAHSAVRELSGIAFRGRTYDIAPILADVYLETPPPDDVTILSGGGAMMVSVPFGDGLYRVAVGHRDHPWTRDEVTLEELAERLKQVLGFDPKPHDPQWLARFKIHQRLADQYRTGRVLLAGDAAHLHSPLGGQGLNLGIQDAVNLGWKLAATLQGWAPAGLLDTYQSERRPQAQKILKATDHATRMATHPSPVVSGLRRMVLARLLGRRRIQKFAGEALSGLRAGYAGRGRPALLGGARLRAGQRVPDLAVPQADGAPVRLYELMRDGRFLLLDLHGDGGAAAVADAWGSRVCPVRVDGSVPQLSGLSAVLVRPDGYAAWVDSTSSTTGREGRVRQALHRWCGTEGPTPQRHPAPTAGTAAPARQGRQAHAEAPDTEPAPADRT